MQSSKVPLQKWAIAIYLLTTQPKGISSVQLAKHLGVTQKTAWTMAPKIREGWNVGKIMLDGTIEVDETYIGRKEKNKHAKKKLHSGRGSVGKTPVVGAKQRVGSVYAEPVASTDADTLTQFILDTVEDKSIVYTEQVEVVIPSRRYRKQPRDYDRIRYRERNIVERFINKLKWCRRISTRYDKLALHFIAFLHFSLYADLAQTKCQRALKHMNPFKNPAT